MEAEFHLLTQEEASGCKVGIGREDPEGLPEPRYVLPPTWDLEKLP